VMASSSLAESSTKALDMTNYSFDNVVVLRTGILRPRPLGGSLELIIGWVQRDQIAEMPAVRVRLIRRGFELEEDEVEAARHSHIQTAVSAPLYPLGEPLGKSDIPLASRFPIHPVLRQTKITPHLSD